MKRHPMKPKPKIGESRVIRRRGKKAAKRPHRGTTGARRTTK
jgi:hypothetical protein